VPQACKKCVYELSKREMQIKGGIKISSLKLLSSAQCAFDGAGENISHSFIRKCGGAIFHCRAFQIFKNTPNPTRLQQNFPPLKSRCKPAVGGEKK
jgi:hypothetical protein